MKLVKAYRKI